MQSYAHTWAFVLRFIVKQLAFATWFCHNSIPERTFRPALTKTSSSTPRIFCYSVKRALARPDSARSQHPCLSQRCWIEWGRDCKQWSQVLRHYPGLAASSWRQTGARDDVLLKHKMHFSKLLPQTWKPTVNLVKQNFMPWHKKNPLTLQEIQPPASDVFWPFAVIYSHIKQLNIITCGYTVHYWWAWCH